jgi:peptide-methionine (S)-S-oxide reductase
MRRKNLWLVIGLVPVAAAVVLWARGTLATPEANTPFHRTTPAGGPSGPVPAGHQLATFGAGCFWCTEAVFQQVNGVDSVVSGYSGGQAKDPTYKQVCTGTTGHAEVIQITFDPAMVSFDELLEIFWQTHDPTTLNRQGHDVGTQYRSAIFYHTEEQREIAQRHKKMLDASGVFDRPIVTEITAFTAFYPAEDYHQNFYQDNKRHPYCSAVIRPKLEKLQKLFKAKQASPAPK